MKEEKHEILKSVKEDVYNIEENVREIQNDIKEAKENVGEDLDKLCEQEVEQWKSVTKVKSLMFGTLGAYFGAIFTNNFLDENHIDGLARYAGNAGGGLLLGMATGYLFYRIGKHYLKNIEGKNETD